MKRSNAFFAAAALLFVIISCSKSNESELTETAGNGGTTNSCDTTNMKFAANVKPILQSGCYPCHSNASFSISGVKLEEYSDVKRQADNGSLLGTITHAAGYPPMPQGSSKLSDCSINKIKSWVNRGAQNN